MKQGVGVALSPLPFSSPLQTNFARIDWDYCHNQDGYKYEQYWCQNSRCLIPNSVFGAQEKIWLEVGAGTGGFFWSLATRHPDTYFIAVERCRFRGNRLVRKCRQQAIPNFLGLRGNLIPALLNGIPSGHIERIYILYPCPFPKTSQRKNRWYLHPVMPHFIRILQPGGLLIWASDQKFYIDEAEYVCKTKFNLVIEKVGLVASHPLNDFASFPKGRTKFEKCFIESGQPCFELISRKP